MLDPRLQSANNIVIAGYWQGILNTLWLENRQPTPGNILYSLTPDDLRRAIEDKKKIFYLEAQEQFVKKSTGADLVAAGAQPF
ncbi:MAG: hypothetical protein HC902_02600 [Calothrix sp. SM1_5_4]|nr:hypothetical protein [Calothrix sp. SM1_5_4]